MLIQLLIFVDVLAHLGGCANAKYRRWFCGDFLTGEKRRPSDAVWWKAASKKSERRSWVSQWALWPGWQRQLVRVVWVEHGGLLLLWLLLAHPDGLRQACRVALIVGALVGVVCADRWWKQRAHHRQWEQPLHEQIAPLLGQPASVCAKDYISVDKQIMQRPDAVATIDVPTSYPASDESVKKLTQVILSNFGSDWQIDAHWFVPRRITVVRTPQPPEVCSYTVCRELIEQCPYGQFFLGLSIGDQPFYWEWTGIFAHLLVSLPTRAGKSTLLNTIAAQAASPTTNALLFIFDGKWISLDNLKGHPAVTYARREDEMNQAARWLEAETDRRYEQLEHDSALTFRPVFVFYEEANATKGWLTERHRQRRGRGTAPAVRILNDLAYRGAQAGIHLVTVAQLADANTIGNAPRENYQMRAFNTEAGWRILAGNPPDHPLGLTTPGYMFIGYHNHYQPIRALRLNTPQTRHIALAGQPWPTEHLYDRVRVALAAGSFGLWSDSDVGGRSGGGASGSGGNGADRGVSVGLRVVGADDDGGGAAAWRSREWLTLKEAWTAGLLGGCPSYYAADQRRHRARKAGTFIARSHVRKAGNQEKYRTRAMRDWWESTGGLWDPDAPDDPTDPPPGGGGGAVVPVRRLPNGHGVSADVIVIEPGGPNGNGRVMLTKPHRLSTTERGYGPEHRAGRRKALDNMRDGDLCCRCFRPMRKPQTKEEERLIHWDHNETRDGYEGLSHKPCNESHGGQLGNRRKRERAAALRSYRRQVNREHLAKVLHSVRGERD